MSRFQWGNMCGSQKQTGVRRQKLLHAHTQGLNEFDQSPAIACLQKLHIGVHFVFTLELLQKQCLRLKICKWGDSRFGMTCSTARKKERKKDCTLANYCTSPKP
jgi:hypothetical protein